MNEVISLLKISKIFELDLEDNSEDLVEIQSSITSAIEEYCNTTFNPVSYIDEVVDSNRIIKPSHLPIEFVRSVYDNGTELIENSDFFVYPDRLILTSPSENLKGVTLSYIGGFSKVPDIVKQVAIDLAHFRRFKEGEGAMLFYKGQVFEEREYEVQVDLTELKILSRLKQWVQGPHRTARSTIRVGVM